MAAAEESARTVSVVAIEIDHLLQSDGSGLYDVMLQRLQAQGLISSIQYAPTRRARRMLEDQSVDCIVPGSDSLQKASKLKPHEVMQSEPFSEAQGYLVFREDHPALSNLTQLAGLDVGVVGIQDVYESTGYSFKPFEVSTYARLADLLDGGRLEAGYFIWPDISRSQVAKEIFDKYKSYSKLIWQSPESFLCHLASEAGVQRLTKAIQALKQAGEIGFESVRD